MTDKELFKQFGGSLTLVRKTSNISQSNLAFKLDCSSDSISRMEQGENVGIHLILRAIHS